LSFARQSRLTLSLLVFVLVVLGSLTRVDLWLPALFRAEICDGLHVPAGMLLCFVASLWLPASHRALVQAIVMVLVGAGLLELLQAQVGRSASWRDVLLATAGAALTSGILYYRRAGKSGLKRPLASLGVALFVVATLPIMNKLVAIEEARALWPQLANFETQQQDILWKSYSDAVITHAEHGELQTSMGMLDQSYLRVDGQAVPPVLRHWVAAADWSAMKTFCLEARYPQPATLRVVFHDGDPMASLPDPASMIGVAPPADASTREAVMPTVDYPLTPHWKRHCTPVQGLGVESGRPLQLSAVRAMTLFVMPSAQPAPPGGLPLAEGINPLRLDLDNVRLY
jgi:hypothetical protein